MKKLLYTIMALTIVMTFSGCNSGDAVDQAANVIQAEDENVLGVKNGTTNLYGDITYAQAFESFFSAPTWKYFKGTQEGPDDDEDGKPDYTREDVDIVEFTGGCTYQNVDVKALIQFELDNENSTFEPVYLSFNQVPQSTLIMNALIEKAFEEYQAENGLE